MIYQYKTNKENLPTCRTSVSHILRSPLVKDFFLLRFQLKAGLIAKTAQTEMLARSLLKQLKQTITTKYDLLSSGETFVSSFPASKKMMPLL